MSIKAIQWAFDIGGLSPTEKLVLVKLADNANDDGECFPKQAIMARQCGLTRESIGRIIARLKEMGIVSVDKRWKRNFYQLHVTQHHISKGDAASHETDVTEDHVTHDHTSCDARSHDHVTHDHTTIEPSIEPSINRQKVGAISAPAPPPEQMAFDQFAELASGLGLPVPQRLTKARAAKLRARLRDCGGLEGWEVALNRIRGSPFLLGENAKGWRADFDFVLQEKSFTKLMEGCYGNGKPAHSIDLDEVDRLLNGSHRPDGGASGGDLRSAGHKPGIDRQDG